MWLAALRDSVRGGKGIVRGDLLQGDPLHRRLDHSGGGIGIGIAHHLQSQSPNPGGLLPRRLRHLRSLRPRRIGEKGRQIAERTFNDKRCAEEIANIIKSAL